MLESHRSSRRSEVNLQINRILIWVVKILAWGTLCGVSGAILGFANGFLCVEPIDPQKIGDDDWYTVFVIIYSLLEGIIVLFIGVYMSLRVEEILAQWVCFGFMLVGAVIGGGVVTAIVWSLRLRSIEVGEGQALIVAILAQIIGILIGMRFGIRLSERGASSRTSFSSVRSDP